MRPWLMSVAVVMAAAGGTMGYPVGPAVSLHEMTMKADLVVKGKVVGSATVEDASFKAVAGFVVQETKLEVISQYKGAEERRVVGFRHYAAVPNVSMNYMPQNYAFETGRCYIVHAVKTAVPGVYRQLWENHRIKEDQGVLLAADDAKVETATVEEMYWLELTKLLTHAEVKDVQYAVRQLDWMSGGVEYANLKIFDRLKVAEAIAPLLLSKSEAIVQAAVTAAGSGNPLMREEDAAFWLATVSDGRIAGFSMRDETFDNAAGRALAAELAAVVDGAMSGQSRALAVRALAFTKAADLPTNLERWTGDKEPAVRQAAVVVLSLAKTAKAPELIEAAASDASAMVRVGAAHAIGFGQFEKLVAVLGRMLQDKEASVRDAAAMSLVSFPPAAAGEVLRANVKDGEYRSVFVNALAASDPGQYIEDLADVIENNLEPGNFWGGRIPAARSWDILFKHVQSQPRSAMGSPEMQRAMDALERSKWYSSSEPRDLYALYLQNGLTERAKSFRERCRTAVSFDMEYYFKLVDQEPGNYRRE